VAFSQIIQRFLPFLQLRHFAWLPLAAFAFLSKTMLIKQSSLVGPIFHSPHRRRPHHNAFVAEADEHLVNRRFHIGKRVDDALGGGRFQHV
jgi:hypothetical protein